MSDNEFARLVYLVLLLIFVGGFIWSSSRLVMKKHLKLIAAWIAIFLLVILFYSQIETLMGELTPGRGVMQDDGKTIALSRAASGSFEAVLDVNGATIRFLVDTGATDVVLSQRDARKAGIDLTGLKFTGQATTANGTVHTAPIFLDQVTLAGITDRDVPATVNGGELSFSLLGMSYLNRFDRIEISGNKMLLVR